MRDDQQQPRRVVVGVDTGGTFTDLVAVIDGRLVTRKLPSTPQDPADAVARGLAALLDERRADVVSYGTTVATNALLERRGARTALVTNEGFEDLLEIGRQARDEIYALEPSKTLPLVPRRLRFGVPERSHHDGRRVLRPGSKDLARLRKRLRDARVESIAIGLLHSYANPDAEGEVARALEPLGVPISMAHRLAPEPGEVERFTTALVNAYVAPRVSAHLERLAAELPAEQLRVLQSDGTATGAARAAAEPVRTALSGPAAGIVGAISVARQLGLEGFLTFDMGGTSTDVALFDHGVRTRGVGSPGGHLVRLPMLDIHTVGSGGGSIARLDAGGALRVGPESAGADPGPACYGRGVEPTVTDANLVLGRLVPERFLGGAMTLEPARARRAIGGLARSMGTSTEAAAAGILRVANAAMERAIRVISLERGADPRDLDLFAFGGAGPLHAAELARRLGCRRVIVPRHPGLLCATGALAAPLGREAVEILRKLSPSLSALRRVAGSLGARVRAELIEEGAARRSIRLEPTVALRYQGQSFEIECSLEASFVDDFHREHRRLFGHADAAAPVEALAVRVRGFADGDDLPTEAAPPAVQRRRATRGTALCERESLPALLRGPAIVTEVSATTWIPEGTRCRALVGGHLALEWDE